MSGCCETCTEEGDDFWYVSLKTKWIFGEEDGIHSRVEIEN